MKQCRAAALLWILSVLTFAAPAAELSAAWAKLFGWEQRPDPQAAAHEFERDARAGDRSARLALLLFKPCSDSDDLKRKLKPFAQELLSEFISSPDKFNAFLLAELLNEPTAGYYDADLALKLYIYSAALDFPLAACRAGSILMSGSQDDMLKAANYLEQASRAQISEADYLLFILYTRLNRPADARKALKRLLAQQHPAAPALQAMLENKSTEQLAGASGYTLRFYALRNCSTSYSQKEFLFKALERGDRHSALLLATLFRSQPQPDHAMAVNSALLANWLYSGGKTAQELLNELDRSQGLAMPLVIMWQNRLHSGKVLHRFRAESNALMIDLTLADTPENRSAIEKLLQKDPEAFLLSGTAFRLLEKGYSAEDFKKLFALVPRDSARLPRLITELLIAARLDDQKWQLQLSQQLFAEAERTLPTAVEINFRKQLLTVLPAAAMPGKAAGTVADPLLYSYFLWNFAVDMRINALLAGGRRSEAELFLKKNRRYRLPPQAARLERNMVRNFARHIVELK